MQTLVAVPQGLFAQHASREPKTRPASANKLSPVQALVQALAAGGAAAAGRRCRKEAVSAGPAAQAWHISCIEAALLRCNAARAAWTKTCAGSDEPHAGAGAPRQAAAPSNAAIPSAAAYAASPLLASGCTCRHQGWTQKGGGVSVAIGTTGRAISGARTSPSVAALQLQAQNPEGQPPNNTVSAPCCPRTSGAGAASAAPACR